MSPLYEKFLLKFKEEFPHLKTKLNHKPSTLEIFSPSHFDSILVVDHDSELTVYLGNLFHQHFPSDLQDVTEEDVIEDVFSILNDIISNKFRIECFIRGEAIVSSQLVVNKSERVISKVTFIKALVFNFFKPESKKTYFWSEDTSVVGQ